MATLSELLKELRTLPLGDIYPKTINGKTYFYHQYFLEGKRHSHIVKAEELETIRQQIRRRKEIERQIKSIHVKDSVLSKNANQLTGYVMNENVVTATFEQGKLVALREDLAPLMIQRTHSLEKFLQLRVMDMSRTNARILKKVLNLDVEEDYKASLYAYALSISDRYWFKPKHSKLTYRDVVFDNDALFETALKGEVNVFYHKAKLSPEITTTGSFEKGWRFLDGQWWLYKKGSDREIFSELFCSAFAKRIGVKTVTYEFDKGYIRCPNFSPDHNFEPMAALLDDNDDYARVFSVLSNIDESIARDYLRLIFFDSVVNNIDRHNENLGLLRDIQSGAILSLAPNFDNNLALVATSETLNDNPKKDGFIRLFVEFLNKGEKAKALFMTLSFPALNIQDISAILQQIPIDVPGKDAIASAVLRRYDYLKNLFNTQHI